MPTISHVEPDRDAPVLTAAQELRLHWPVVAASFVGLMIGAWSLPLYLIGPLSKSFEADFAWSRTDVVASTTFLAIGATLGAPLVGLLVDRVAPRIVALVSTLFLALGMASLALLDGAVFHLHLIYFAMSFLGAGSGGVSFTRAIGGWFRSARGLALGIALCGTGAGAFITPLLAQSLLGVVGWRAMCLWLAGGIILVAVPIIAFGLKTPKPGETARKIPAPDMHGVTRRTAMRDPRFYILFLSVGIFGAFIGGIVVHLVPMLTDRGLTPMHAAQVASLLGIAIMVGRLSVGSLLDRLPPALVGAGIFLLGAIGATIFVVGGTGFAVTMVIAIGLLLGAEVDLLSFLALRYFGPRHYGEIFGLLFSGYSGCAMTSPFIAGALIGLGGYEAMFTGAALGFLTSGLLLLGLALTGRGKARPAAATPSPI